jgi:hypothetical protein
VRQAQQTKVVQAVTALLMVIKLLVAVAVVRM